MPDTPALTPPPDEPMSEDAKARIRHRLNTVAHSDAGPGGAGQGGPGRRPRRWLVPGLAAAAVLAVVGGAFVVASTTESDTEGGGSLQPAGGTTSVAPQPTEPPSPTPTHDPPTPTASPGPDNTPTPTTIPPTHYPTPTTSAYLPPTPSPTPTTSAHLPPTPSPTPTTTPYIGPQPEPPPDKARTCADEVEALGNPRLQGAEVTADRDYGPGMTYLYETKSAWVVCDGLTATDGGAPTLLTAHDKSLPYAPSAETLGISENVITNPDGSWAYGYYFAGGRDFDGVQAISYSFPDDHTEQAVVGHIGLWSMNYVATSGPLFDPKTNFLTLDPIEVTVDYTSGPDRTYRLSWGLDSCGQTNHGC